jgi:hypothetical protein
MTTLPDLFLAQLIRDYLAATETDAVDDGIAKAVMDNGLEPERPSILIAAREDEAQSKGPRRVLQVSIMLLTWLKAADAGAAAVSKFTTRSEAMSLLYALDKRLRNVATFSTWLADLDEERLEGYTILKIVQQGAVPPMRMQDTNAINYAVQQRWSLAVSLEN